MSLQKLSCPHCSFEFDIEVWDSITVSLQPKLRDRLLSEDLFVYTCPRCQKLIYAPYPIVYHDTKKRFMLLFGSENLAGDKGSLPADVAKQIQSLADYTVRKVQGIMNMKEKILLLEVGLDDVAIEYLKHLIVTKEVEAVLEGDAKAKATKLLFSQVENKQVHFVQHAGDYQFTGELYVPYSLYTNTLEKVKADKSLHAQAGDNVNQLWLEKKLQLS